MKFTFSRLLFILGILCSQVIAAQGMIKTDSLSHLLIDVKNQKEKIKILLQLSTATELADPKGSFKFAEDAYHLSNQIEYDSGMICSMIAMGKNYVIVNDFKKAIEFGEQAQKLSEKNNFLKEAAIAGSLIAVVYAELGDYDKSSGYYFKNLKLFEKLNDKVEIGVTYGNIGADFLSQGNYIKAIEYINKSLNLAKQTGDKSGIAQQYNNLASVNFSSYRDYRKAMYFFNMAHEVNRELGDKLQQGINLLNIGYCYFRLNISDSALIFFENAHASIRESGNPMRLANCEIALGTYYFESSDFNKSLNHSKAALNIGIEHHSNDLIVESSDIIYKIYLGRKDTINAFKYSLLNFQARDSLQVMQSQKTLFKLEYQYNFEKQDKERKLKQQRSNFIIVSLILGLLSGIIIIFLIYSRQRIKIKNAMLEKQQMASDMNYKNKELTINLMALMKKNDMLADISKKLIIIEKEMPKDKFRDAVNKLNKELKQTTDEKIWKEFALRFNQINNDFYEKLLMKYPDLTQNELKLSAYLRLNMTSKEVSELTGQRTLTLESARYRLRKKLGISGSDNNLVTFLSQI